MTRNWTDGLDEPRIYDGGPMAVGGQARAFAWWMFFAGVCVGLALGIRVMP